MRGRPRQRGDFQKKAPRVKKLVVKDNITLLPFLFEQLKEQSKSSVKAMLAHGQILVNGKAISQFDTPLQPNDVVGISYERGKVAFSHPLLNLIWEDDDLIVVNKKDGIMTVAPAATKERTASQLLNAYVKKTDPRSKVFLLHQLGKNTSGLMIFAKNRGVQSQYHSYWDRMVTKHSFIAVVEGTPEKKTDLLIPGNDMEEPTQSYVTMEGDGKHTVVRYNILQSNKHYSLLELDVETGRKPNIRDLLAHIGHPIAGDARNQAETSPANRLMLHSTKLSFIHPVSGTEMCFETPIPVIFKTVTK